mgnify:CR=1 FL=1
MSAKQERRKNRVVWFEIPASDLTRATKFYETILSTSLKAETFGTHELRVFEHDDDAASGCLMKGPGFEPGKAGVDQAIVREVDQPGTKRFEHR